MRFYFSNLSIVALSLAFAMNMSIFDAGVAYGVPNNPPLSISNVKLPQNGDSKHVKDVWSKTLRLSEKTAPTFANGDTGKSVMDFITMRDSEYVRFMREAFNILANDESQPYFDKVMDLKDSINVMRLKIQKNKAKMLGLPEKSSNPLAETVESVQNENLALERKIKEKEQEIPRVKAQLLATINKYGKIIDAKSLDALLDYAGGNDILKLMSVAKNFKQIFLTIEQSLSNDISNVPLAKTYTGMYLSMLEAWKYAHKTALDNNAVYTSKIQDIIKEAEANIKEGNSIKATSPAARQNIEANARLNNRTISVAKRYNTILEQNAKRIKSSQATLDDRIALARNTYKTMSNSLNLMNLMQSGEKDIDALFNFSMPELKNLYELSAMNGFKEISERIKIK